MKKINTALCSFGMSGLVFHAPFLHAHPGFEFYAVWERTQKKAAAIYPSVRSFDTLDDMLKDETIELVIVNTPNYTHHEFARKAMLAGKNVLVEKSFTVAVSEAEDLLETAKKQGVLLGVYQNRRYDSDFKTVQQVLAGGALGDILEAEFHFDRFKPELSPKQHKENAIPGAGLLHDLGPHLIDQALFLFGMPRAVFGFLRTVRPTSKVNDCFDITLFYDRHIVRLKSSLMVKEAIPAYILHGLQGSFIKERADIQEDILKAGQKPGSKDWGMEPESARGLLNVLKEGQSLRTRVSSLPGNYFEYYDRLYDALTQHAPMPVSGDDGLRVMQVIDAVERSNQDRAVVLLKL